jgi:pullulanase-type alpha-1,6-glucosidase
MMEKLLIDSVVTWARDYKVDGFRFDLMGHHSKANMLKLRAALDELTLEDDGVDGSSIYLYGEGWNFGEVANDARFVQATQANMAGTGIGTFNDRLRDAVRGGGPFDGGDALVLNQGVINGLWYDPNEAVGPPTQAQLDELLLSADQIRVGLAGNLADYEFVDRNGDTVKGSEVDYNGSPAGYNDDPQEHIVYVAAHDNQTLWDIGQYHHPLSTSTADRVRAQNLGMDFTVLAQGVPFVHAGEDLLRTKQMDRNSYDSGDWFNRVDFSGTTNHWGGGVPPAPDNEANWGLIKPRLARLPAPSATDISASAAHLREMLAVRESSPLFRLGTGAEVQERLRFHNTGPDQQPGLIVMTIDDPGAAPLTTGDLDPGVDRLAVLFNPTDEAITYAIDSWVGEPSVALHPILVGSSDDVVGDSAFDSATGTFSVPARTTAVFVDDPDDTPPTLTAELRRVSGTATMGGYMVLLGCADPGGGTVDLQADVNGVAVEHADVLLLIRYPTPAGPLRIGTLTILWGPSFTLTATCTDAAGNTTTQRSPATQAGG